MLSHTFRARTFTVIQMILLVIALALPSCAGNTHGKNADDGLRKELPDTISLLFVGDAMQHGPQLNAALKCGGGKNYDYSDCFTLIKQDITEADYAVANLEVPLGGGPTYRGYPNFSSPDAYAKALGDSGFDLLLTANNHCLDSGDKAAKRTLTALDELKLDHIGTYVDTTDRKAKVPFIKDIRGTKIAFLNYTYGTNGIRPTSGTEIAVIDRQKIAQEMALAKHAGADAIIVTMHWGIEYNQLENENQRSLAQFMIDHGADMIIGSHPHVVQPMKVMHSDKTGKDVLVVYSLGNFISNQNDTNSRGGALVRARLVRDTEGKVRFDSADYDVFFTAKPEGSNHNYKVVPSWQSDKIPSGQLSTWRLFDRNATKIFDTHNVNVPRRHAADNRAQ